MKYIFLTYCDYYDSFINSWNSRANTFFLLVVKYSLGTTDNPLFFVPNGMLIQIRSTYRTSRRFAHLLERSIAYIALCRMSPKSPLPFEPSVETNDVIACCLPSLTRIEVRSTHHPMESQKERLFRWFGLMMLFACGKWDNYAGVVTFVVIELSRWKQKLVLPSILFIFMCFPS